jgi:hypothetical protein
MSTPMKIFMASSFDRVYILFGKDTGKGKE